MEQREFHAAVDDYDKALSLDSNNIEVRLARAAAFEGVGRLDSALTEYEEVIVLRPRDVRAYVARACLHERMGNLADAIADFGQAIEWSPNDTWLLKRRAKVYVLTGEIDKGIEDYTAALRIGNEADSWGGRGIARARKGQYREAWEDLTKAIELGGGTAEVYYCRGCVYLAGVQERRIAVQRESGSGPPETVRTAARSGSSGDVREDSYRKASRPLVLRLARSRGTSCGVGPCRFQHGPATTPAICRCAAGPWRRGASARPAGGSGR